jgi:hypothetical protein
MRVRRDLFGWLMTISLSLGFVSVASAQDVQVVDPRMQAELLEMNGQVKLAFNDGDHENARRLANELLARSEDAKGTWYHGNLIYTANLVLGRIALAEEDVEKASGFLLRAGRTPGSPQLNSFGPNMTLARDLLEIGQKKAVLSYFDLVETFWEHGSAKLKQWREEIAAGKVPDFGPNLRY